MTYDEAMQWAGGTQTKLARRLGIAQATVSAWRRTVPAHYQFQVQVLSGGALKVDPELLPEELRQP